MKLPQRCQRNTQTSPWPKVTWWRIWGGGHRRVNISSGHWFTHTHQDTGGDRSDRKNWGKYRHQTAGWDDEWLERSRCFNCLAGQEIMRLKMGFLTVHVWHRKTLSNTWSNADQNLGLFLHFCVFFRPMCEHRIYFYQLFCGLLWKKSSQWWMTADWSLRRSFPSASHSPLT